MSKRIKLTGILLVLVLAVSSQQMWNYPEVDKKSYELFQQQKWAELIDFADEARSNGIDYFYLQARTGIACYNLKKYRIASDYFLNTWENDQSFEWLQEYLYYSLLYSGRSVEASKYATHFSVAFKEKINYQNMKPLRMSVEAGYSFNPDFDALANRAFDEELNVGSDYGEAFILKNYHFESVDYSHQLAPGIFLSHNFTHLGINREEQVFWGQRYTFPIDVKQNQYFINPTFVLGKKWYVSPSATVIWGKSNLVLGNYNPNTFYATSVKFSDFIFSTSTWSHFGNFAPGTEVNFANIYNEGFTQLSGWITYYPFSNTNFYITPRVYFKSDKENGFGYNTFGISGGAQLGPVHFYGQYLNGDMKNFIEPAGYVVANFPGRSEQKIMGSLYFPMGKQYQFVLRYINQDMIEKYYVYTNMQISNSLEYKYIKHTLTAGISWNF
jgi:hypothetical protein